MAATEDDLRGPLREPLATLPKARHHDELGADQDCAFEGCQSKGQAPRWN